MQDFSLRDFVLVLPDSAVLSPESATDFRQSLGTAQTLTTRLADERIPAWLLKSIHGGLKVGKVAGGADGHRPRHRDASRAASCSI